MPKVTPISLDGSTLEGGGQLVRVAFALSAITGIPVHAYNIRANRMPKGRSGRGAGGDQKSASLRGERGGNRNVNTSERRSGSGGNGRKVEGGAKESHLAAVVWLAGKCGASLEGAEVGSRDITFFPGGVGGGGSGRNDNRKGSTLVDFQKSIIHLERPGSVCLILQCILPYLLFDNPFATAATGQATSEVTLTERSIPNSTLPTSTSTQPKTITNTSSRIKTQTTEVTLHGGTNVDKAMSTDYIQHVFLPMLHLLTSRDSDDSNGSASSLPDIEVETVRRGWAGSAPRIGEVKVRVTYNDDVSPCRLYAMNATERGDISKISVVIITHGEENRSTILTELTTELAQHFSEEVPIEVITNEDSGDIRRLYILLIAHTTNNYRLGRDVLGTGRTPKNAVELKKIIGESVKGVVKGLREEVRRGGCVDEFMADQVVVFQALAKGRGRIDGGNWREGGKGKGDEDEEVGDEDGSLHARTVRWVCEKMLTGKALSGGRDGVKFEKGGICTGIGWNFDTEG